ncbi:MAG: hypothetical protein ACI4XW_01535, partial [Candidatus Spyradocola sp.]
MHLFSLTIRTNSEYNWNENYSKRRNRHETHTPRTASRADAAAHLRSPRLCRDHPPTKPTGYEDYTLLKQGETVTADTPFLIDLTGIRNDFNPDNGNKVEILTKLSGTMYIDFLIYKDMPETDRG